MRKFILQIDISLDGFAAGANDDTRWVTSDAEMNQDASELLDTVDTLLLGRVAYQVFVRFWPTANFDPSTIEHKIACHLNKATKLIFSRTLEQVEWGTWGNAKLIKNNAVEEITRMKSEAGKNLLLYAGADIASYFIQSGLIDSYRLRIHPVILGQGKSLFQHVKDQQNLKLVRTKSYNNGAVMLVYQRP